MPERSATPAQRFAVLVEAFGGRPDVTVPGEPGRRTFGSAALKVNRSIFAMLTDDQLVVKLPGARVAALIQAGAGQPFYAGKATSMKEWVIVTEDDERAWRDLTEEAYAFVRSRSHPPKADAPDPTPG